MSERKWRICECGHAEHSHILVMPRPYGLIRGTCLVPVFTPDNEKLGDKSTGYWGDCPCDEFKFVATVGGEEK